jgi:Protein of unknown function (DUF2971)
MMKKWEKLLKRVQPGECKFLYKYRSINSKGLERIFSHNELYHSDPTTFNDPFDCRPLITTHRNDFKRNEFYKSIAKQQFPNANKKQIKNEVKKNPSFKKLKLPVFLENCFIKFLKDYGLYCLSEIPDNILMWSHYSDSHKGVCLQFKADKERTIFWEAFKVTYQEEYPKVNIMDMGNKTQFFDLFATKSNSWEYEQERRIIKSPDEGGSKVYSFQPELLTGVILGAKMSKEDEETINKWVSKNQTPIPIYKATINKKSYTIDIKGITY